MQETGQADPSVTMDCLSEFLILGDVEDRDWSKRGTGQAHFPAEAVWLENSPAAASRMSHCP